MDEIITLQKFSNNSFCFHPTPQQCCLKNTEENLWDSKDFSDTNINDLFEEKLEFLL